MKQETELKPCPFCGGEAELKDVEDNCMGRKCWVRCRNCSFTTLYSDYPEWPVSAWNTRAQSDTHVLSETTHPQNVSQQNGNENMAQPAIPCYPNTPLNQANIDAALKLLQVAAIHEGFVLVPKEPTGAIILAWCYCFMDIDDWTFSDIYRAMIQAAQEENE